MSNANWLIGIEGLGRVLRVWEGYWGSGEGIEGLKRVLRVWEGYWGSGKGIEGLGRVLRVWKGYWGSGKGIEGLGRLLKLLMFKFPYFQAHQHYLKRLSMSSFAVFKSNLSMHTFKLSSERKFFFFNSYYIINTYLLWQKSDYICIKHQHCLCRRSYP